MCPDHDSKICDSTQIYLCSIIRKYNELKENKSPHQATIHVCFLHDRIQVISTSKNGLAIWHHEATNME